MRKTYLALFLLLITYHAQAINLTQSVPANNAINVNTDGKIVLTFDADVAAGSGLITLNGKTMTPTFVSKYATFSYAGLDFETPYTFVVPTGAIKSKSGDNYSGITINFKTKKRPEISPKTFDFIVDQKATPISGKVGRTIASAIDAAPNSSGVRYHVFIKNGLYNETVTLPSDKQNISFIGQSADSVVIRDISNPVFTINGNFLYFENLTIQNTANPDYTQYGIAVYAEGSKNIFKNVRLLGHQDTQRTGGDRHYYLHCDIRGTIDFIYGSGDIFYDSCSIYLEPRNLMMKTSTTWDTCCCITAGSQDNTNKWGFVFNQCSIDGDKANDNRYSLGRPWHNSARSVFLNTSMKIKPFEYGWTSMGGTFPGLYAEYGSKDAQGNPIDLSKRQARYILQTGGDTLTAPFNPVLDEATAANYTLGNVLGGSDSWKPNRIALAPAAPTLSFNGSQYSWNATPYTMCYVIFRDGRVVDFVTTTTYTPSENGLYSICAVGEYGNLSERSNVLSTQGTAAIAPIDRTFTPSTNGRFIRIDNVTEPVDVTLYSITGVILLHDRFECSGERAWTNAQPCIARFVSGSVVKTLFLIPSTH